MINEKIIFNEIHNNISLMCRDDCEGADLAAATGLAMSNRMKSICVLPNHVAEVWPWLEKSKVKIIARFFIDRTINDEFMSDFAAGVSGSFRTGADGAIVFLGLRDLDKFAAEIVSIRDDLFFNKSFSIGMDIDEIGPFDWEHLFGILHLVRADSLVLKLAKDTGDKSDFVGRVFAMLNTERGKWAGAVNFVLEQNIVRIDQTFRLIQQLKPETISKTEFFIDNDEM